MAENRGSLTRKDIVLLFLSLVVTVIGAVVGAFIVGEGRFAKYNPTQLQWEILLISLIALIITVVLTATKWQDVRIGLIKVFRITRAWFRWLVINWKKVVGIMLLIGSTLGIYQWTKSLWAILPILGLVFATLLIASAFLGGNQQQYLVIFSAFYGAEDIHNDVTSLLNSKNKSGKLAAHVHNANNGGDPVQGIVKTLKVEYLFAGSAHTKTATEGETLSLP